MSSSVGKLSENGYKYISDELKMLLAKKAYQFNKKLEENKSFKYTATVDKSLRQVLRGDVFSRDIKLDNKFNLIRIHPDGKSAICHIRLSDSLERFKFKHSTHDKYSKFLNSNYKELVDFQFFQNGSRLLLLFEDKIAAYALKNKNAQPDFYSIPSDILEPGEKLSHILALNFDADLIIIKTNKDKLLIKRYRNWEVYGLHDKKDEAVTVAAISKNGQFFVLGGSKGSIDIYLIDGHKVMKSDIEYRYTSQKQKSTLFEITKRVIGVKDEHLKITDIQFVPGEEWMAVTHEGGLLSGGGVFAYYGVKHDQTHSIFAAENITRFVKSAVQKIKKQKGKTFVRNAVGTEDGNIFYFDLAVPVRFSTLQDTNLNINSKKLGGLKSKIINLSISNNSSGSLITASDINYKMFSWDLTSLELKNDYWKIEVNRDKWIRSVEWIENKDKNTQKPYLSIGSNANEKGFYWIYQNEILSSENKNHDIKFLKDIDVIRDIAYWKKYDLLLLARGNQESELFSVLDGNLMNNIDIVGTAQKKYTPHSNGLWSVDYTKTKNLIATGDWDGIVNFWQVQKKKNASAEIVFKHSLVIPELKNFSRMIGTRKFRIRSLEFHPDGEWLAIAGKSDMIILCPTNNLDHIEPVYVKTTGMGGEIMSIAFNNQGILAAAGREGMVEIWSDMNDLENKISIRAHKGTIHDIQFSGNEPNALFTAGQDGVVRKWIPKTSDEDHLLDYLYYDPIEYKIVKDKKDSSAVIYSFALTNDENHLVAGTDNGYLHIWNLNAEVLKNNITSLTWRTLTDTEKNIYIDKSLNNLLLNQLP